MNEYTHSIKPPVGLSSEVALLPLRWRRLAHPWSFTLRKLALALAVLSVFGVLHWSLLWGVLSIGAASLIGWVSIYAVPAASTLTSWYARGIMAEYQLQRTGESLPGSLHRRLWVAQVAEVFLLGVLGVIVVFGWWWHTLALTLMWLCVRSVALYLLAISVRPDSRHASGLETPQSDTLDS